MSSLANGSICTSTLGKSSTLSYVIVWKFNPSLRNNKTLTWPMAQPMTHGNGPWPMRVLLLLLLVGYDFGLAVLIALSNQTTICSCPQACIGNRQQHRALTVLESMVKERARPESMWTPRAIRSAPARNQEKFPEHYEKSVRFIEMVCSAIYNGFSFV